MNKKYNIIYADPAWQQKAGRPLTGYKKENGAQVFNPLSNTSAELPYKTMSIEEIKLLPIIDICDKDAHLYMWVTNKYLMEVGEVIKAWGFKYSTTLVWVKKPMGGGLGGSYKISTEFLIFATKGKLKTKKGIKGTWFDVKRKYVNGYPCHSKKPDFFREMIESVSTGNKIELFARENNEGWDAWGNEVGNSIKLPIS
ncbi:MAG: MT-A70 family methyltransferase [Ferruginibacter sp.]